MRPRPSLLLNVARPWGGDDGTDVALDALAAGFDGVGLVDSPRLFPDAWVETQRVLDRTPARLAGPCVASLGLRHPATVAGALRTLERHHPGRVAVVVGRGESSVRNEGLPVPSMVEHAVALGRLREAVGDLAEGRVLGAASGPRTIVRTAAALGGVLIDVGVDPRVVSRAVTLAREQEPGCTLWLFLRAVVTAGEAEAVAAAEPLIGSCATRLVRAPDFYGLDDVQVRDVDAVARSHDYTRHGAAGARRGPARSADRLVRDMFTITGDGPSVVARVRPLVALGIQGVVVAGAMRGVTDRLPELGTALLDALTTDAG